MADHTTPAATPAPDFLDVLTEIMREVGRAQHGRNFGDVVLDPSDGSSWIFALRDGTTSCERIGCLRS